MKITQSLLGAADKCMLSLQYTLDRPEWAKNVAGAERLVGTGYHAGLELFYRHRLDMQSAGFDDWNDVALSDLIAEAIRAFDLGCAVDDYTGLPVDELKWSETVPDRDAAVARMTAMLCAYIDGGHAYPEDWVVLDVEFADSVILDHQFKLGADLILQDPNGWLVLVDHKTAGKAWDQNKHHPRKNNQGALYTALAPYFFPGHPGYRFVFDIMQYPNKSGECKFERRVCDPVEGHFDAVLKKANDLAFLYETVHLKAGMDLPANPASTLCNPKWCDFFDGCPHGAALDK